MAITSTKFVNGCALKEENKVVYFIPKFTNGGFPIDLTVLEVLNTSETRITGRKSYEGYKAHIIAEKVKDLEILVDADTEEGDTTSILLRNLKNALNHDNQFELALGAPKDSCRILEFWRKDKNQNKRFGHVELETIELVPSMGRLLETIVFNLSEVSELNFQLQTSSEKIHAKQSELESNLKNLVKDKSRMEDRMCRAFMKTLNAKKKRITELLKEIEELKDKFQRQTDVPSTGMPTSSSKLSNVAPIIEVVGSSEDGKNSDGDSATDYESETDVNDSDDGVRPVVESTKSSKSLPTTTSRRKSLSKSPGDSKQNPQEQQERLSKCVQNLFPTEDSEALASISKSSVSDSTCGKTSFQLPKPSCKPDNNMLWSQSSVSSESSQELFPVLRKRKSAIAAGKSITSTSGYKLRNKSKPKCQPMDIEENESSEVIANQEESKVDPLENNLQSKKRKPNDCGDSQKNSDSPMGDEEILGQIFGDFD